MSNPVFEPVPTPFRFSAAEHDIVKFWKERQIYHKSLEQRHGAPPFVFYEGPPTANGMPHPGHCLTRTIKDIFPRYKTMDGYYCERKAGWDTHGLPVEIEVCKQLGILEGGKAAIEEYGVEQFNRACIESVFRYQKEWEDLTDRIGFWVNLDEAYVTFHQSYVESVWWALKTLFDRGLLYQGHKVVWWWAQGGTALSAGEVGEGYRDTDDPAITIRLDLDEASHAKLGLDCRASLLAWTTTPWTLSSNCAACVGADIDYALVHRVEGDTRSVFILAESLVEKYFGEGAEIIRTVKGADLLGLKYVPLFNYGTPEHIEGGGEAERYWEVIPGDFVDLETGTGIVHIAPAFGEDDYRVCREQGIGFLCFVKPDGTFDERVTDKDPYDGAPIAGQFCKAADKGIIRVLKERGMVLKHEQYKHSYPFCPRAENDPLIQYARKSWFIRTSQFIEQFVANNREINWQPEHIRDGRFGNFLENNVDWALSRERYWGTPLPVWICEKTGQMECISSYAELLARPGVQGTEVWEKAKAAEPSLSEHLKVHKPYIDAVTYQSPFDPSARMRRVTEVIDVWFDAGSMPFAQWGYPHVPGSEELLTSHFPADFISEGLDQTRGWFYALLAISTVVFGEDRARWPHPFKNCICLGLVHGEDGLKLSKRLRNYKDPNELFDTYSADALRWSLIGKNPPTTAIRLTERNVEEAQREMMMRWYNVYSFFVIYANLDGFDPFDAPESLLTSLGCPRNTAEASEALGGLRAFSGVRPTYVPAEKRGELDRWVLNELERTILTVRVFMDDYETYPAARALTEFLDGLSNWYVRRSRARFWASAWSQDKTNAYWTLYECLLKLAQMMAPFTPFFAETTWRNLAKPLPGAPESVHLSDFPKASEKTSIEPTQNAAEQVRVGGQTAGATALEMIGQVQKEMEKFKTAFQVPGAAMQELGAQLQRDVEKFKTAFQIPGAITQKLSDQLQRDAETIKAASKIPDVVLQDLSAQLQREAEKFKTAFQIPGAAMQELGAQLQREAEKFKTAFQIPGAITQKLSAQLQREAEKFKTAFQVPGAAMQEQIAQLQREAEKLRSAFQMPGAAMQEQIAQLQREAEKFKSAFQIPGAITQELLATVEGNVRRVMTNKDQAEAIGWTLIDDMSLTREAVTLGLNARRSANIKVRQPLGHCQIILASERFREALTRHSDLLIEELNIKEVAFSEKPDDYVTYEVKPNFKVLGPKCGAKVKKVGAALSQGSGAAFFAQMRDTGAIRLDIDGETIELGGEDVDVRLQPKPGFAAAQSTNMVVVLSTEITEELRHEGWVRDFVRIVQDLRKEQNVAYDARVEIAVHAADKGLEAVLRQFEASIAETVLARSVRYVDAPPVGSRTGETEAGEVTVLMTP